MYLQPIFKFEVIIALVALVRPQGSAAAVIDPQTWWKFGRQEKGSVIKTWDRLLSSSIRNHFGHRKGKRGVVHMYLYFCRKSLTNHHAKLFQSILIGIVKTNDCRIKFYVDMKKKKKLW